MDRTAFLERLFTMFPQNFNENNISYWSEAYESVLNNSKINYDKLFRTMIMNWTTLGSAPSPKWFADSLSSVIEKDERSNVMIHLEEIKKDAVPMPEDFKIRMQALKEKMSMGA